MIGYYGTKVSTNITRTPEGYLVAHRVPIGRIGWQDYTPKELGVESLEKLVKVYRPASEVFHPHTLRSFEGKDVTDDHPHQAVEPSNWSAYSKGHVQNVHRGTVEESTYNDDAQEQILADLVIKDGNLINKVEPKDGKREVSCGYNYVLHCFECKKPYKVEGEDSCTCSNPTRFEQHTIRGNHVAIVDTGRAGPSVSIHDTGKDIMEETVTVTKGFMDRMLEALLGQKQPIMVATDSKSKDDMDLELERKARDARVDKMCDAWEKKEKEEEDKKAKDKKVKDEEPEEVMDAEEKESEEEEEEKEHKSEEEETGDSDLEKTEVLEAHERPFNPIPGADRAAQISFLKAIKPAIAKANDSVATKAFNKALRTVKGTSTSRSGNDGYSQMNQLNKPESKTKVISPEEDARIYEESMAKLKGKGFAATLANK